MSYSKANKADFVGSRFGRFIVMALAGHHPKSKHLMVMCKCDCGTEKVVMWNRLRMGNSQSCGCICRERTKNEIGHRYGQLSVLSRVDKKPGTCWAMWLCKCDCGKQITVSGVKLRSGSTRNCGCAWTKKRRWRLESGVAAKRRLFCLYRRNADNRDLVWELTEAQTYELFGQDCYYCGSEPSTVSGRKQNNGKFVGNGIDRVDSTLGYIISNVVTCCKRCNWLKGASTLESFYGAIARIALRHPEILTLPDLVR